MGKIEVTTNSSVRLGNIGSVRVADAGDRSAASRALSRLGGAIAEVGMVGARIRADTIEKENKIAVNNAMRDIMVETNRLTNEIVNDSAIAPSDYESRFRTGYEKLYADRTKEMNANQREMMSAASGRFFASSLMSMNDIASRRINEASKTSAANLAAAAKLVAINDNSEDSIKFYVDAFTDANPDILRDIERYREEDPKKAALLQESLRIKQRQCVDDVESARFMRKIAAAESIGNEAVLEEYQKKDWSVSDNPNAAYNVATKRTGFGPNTSAALKGEAEKALMRVRSRRYEQATAAAQKEEISMFLTPLPGDTEGIKARFLDNADKYKQLAENEHIPLATRRSYAKTAESLREAAIKVEHEVATQAQLNFFNGELNNFVGGKDLITGKDLTYDEMKTRARELLSTGKITSTQFHRLMSVQMKELNEEQKRFRDLVYADFPKLMPNITQRDGRFVFKPSKKVPSADKSTGYEVDVERGFWNDTEEVYSYSQFIRAMNAIFNLSKAQGLSAEEMKAMFDERTMPVRDGCNSKSINQCLEEIEENASSAARARANPGAVPPFVQKGRRTKESGIKPWDSPQSIGSQYLRDIFNK